MFAIFCFAAFFGCLWIGLTATKNAAFQDRALRYGSWLRTTSPLAVVVMPFLVVLCGTWGMVIGLGIAGALFGINGRFLIPTATAGVEKQRQ